MSKELTSENIKKCIDEAYELLKRFENDDTEQMLSEEELKKLLQRNREIPEGYIGIPSRRKGDE